jgi:hypothetical protein
VHTVRHPITTFIIAVLVVIGIGVGIVAITQTSKVYGPSWARFTAAFTGHVYETEEHSTAGGTITGTAFYYATRPGHWFSYSPRSGASYQKNLRAVSVMEPELPYQDAVLTFKRYFFRVGVTERVQDGQGWLISTLGPQCENGQCNVARFVSKGQVLWSMFAFSKGPVSTVEDFLASFQPIG